MGVESALNGHKTLVLGTSGMTVLDQATGYSVFANGGYSGTRHGITQLVSRSGQTIYDHAADAPEPVRVLSAEATLAMNTILSQVPEWGTGRRAALTMTKAAGKTGTGQAYRDAWFVGYTGNYVAAVWMGNDDFTPTRRLTGGSLPAMTWQRLMDFAHQNVELKPIPGIAQPIVDNAVASTETDLTPDEQVRRNRPKTLSAATSKLLTALSEKFSKAPVIDPPARSTKVSALSEE